MFQAITISGMFLRELTRLLQFPIQAPMLQEQQALQKLLRCSSSISRQAAPATRNAMTTMPVRLISAQAEAARTLL